MKSWKIIAIVTAVAVVAAAVFTASAYAMMSGQVYLGSMHGTNIVSTYGYYGNMMNGVYPAGLGGMMSGYAYNQQGTDCGNNGQIPNYSANGTNPISINAALTDAQNYITTLNNPDLTIKQVEEYSNNFYVQVTEKSTGNCVFELVVDKYTGAVFPEMGPNMMWNTKYATQTGGMMSGYNYGNTVTPTTTTPVNTTQANANAQQYLNANYPGTTTGDVTTFYGYYTIEVLNNGNTYGMISVNGYTGQVWFHTWHGTFIQELQVS
ncbi:MAG: hypothetical protein M1167_04140 [Chloroflexi bacterium]|nr:hypothetical protein [Chloroflexota bacterium]